MLSAVSPCTASARGEREEILRPSRVRAQGKDLNEEAP